MSTKLLKLAHGIRRSTLSYVRTAYETNNPVFNDARDLYLEGSGQPNRIFGDELFELVPRYRKSDQPFDEALLEVFDRSEGWAPDRRMAFIEGAKMLAHQISGMPYTHQIESLKETICGKKNVVVTTGTGSGKTICFLAPLITNLLLESVGVGNRRAWSAAGQNRAWWKDGSSDYVYERGSNRTSAVRCLIIYPLNALVRDQIEALRSILDSEAAEGFYEKSLGGDRIYFGQYVGATKGQGQPSEPKRRNQAREYLRAAYADYLRADELRKSGVDADLWRHLESPVGSQMLLRWDMQAAWPDILITNFTMLSIMMVREREKSFFESTRRWLHESDQNVFYLVLDELHSYRGTPGTEISHTIKLFLDSLGLFLGHPQLRVVATSASLEDQSEASQDPEFLREFFGGSTGVKRFQVITGETCISPAAPAGANKQEKLGRALADYERGTLALGQLEDVFSQTLGGAKDSHNGSEIENLVWGLQHSLRDKYSRGAALGPVPFRPSDLDRYLFGGIRGAGRGLIRYVVEQNSNRFIDDGAKLRLHLLIKTLPGIRRAMIAENGRLSEPPSLYDQDTKFCPETGQVTLDALYCQVCGELYYRAYRQEPMTGNAGGAGITISNELDRPVSRAKQIYLHEADRDIDCPENWQRWYLCTERLQIVPGSEDPNSLLVDWVECESDSPPSTCIACKTSWRSRGDNVTSPIRTMGTGYYKFSQLLIEQLFEALADPRAQTSPASCISFSDSRRDAARFAAEVELNHYRDALRAVSEAAIIGFSSRGADRLKFIDAVLSNDQTEIGRLKELLGNDADRIFLELKFNNLPVETVRNRVAQKVISFVELADAVERHLVEHKFRIDGFGVENQDDALPLWMALGRDSNERSDADVEIIKDARSRLRRYLGTVITDSLGRDFESIGIGWLTVDRSKPMPAGVDQSRAGHLYIVLDMVLRFLSFYYRTRHEGEVGLEQLTFPKYFYETLVDSPLLRSVVGEHDVRSNSSLFLRVRELLQHYGLVDELLRIRRTNLYIHLPDSTYWVCNRCRAIHMFHADGQCRTIKYLQRCDGQLDERPISELISKPNYYKDFLREQRHLYPIRTAEIIGHTPPLEQRDRQLAFQGKFLSREIGKAMAEAMKIDLLSVTTTMEAGVDIGALKAVFLANMPPRRFNYQQRVGRAGRRQDRISIALTFCKGQKHDEYYFARPELMLAERTASPKLDVTNADILARVILKWFMNDAAAQVLSLEDFRRDDGGINSGNLGSLEAFGKRSVSWLEKFDDFYEVLAQKASLLANELDAAEAQAIVEKCREMLTSAVSILDQWKSKYSAGFSLSEVLVKEGYFPLYGMPEREVSLLISDPNSAPNNAEWPISEGIISRSEDIAISEFAPQQEYLRDKKRYKSNAVAWLVKRAGRICATEPPSHLIRELYICSSCSRVTAELVEQCDACGEVSINHFHGKRARYYCADRAQGYAGFLDSSPQSIITSPAPEARGSILEAHQRGSASIHALFGNVLRINCNDGLGFEVTERSMRIATPSLGGLLSLAPSGSPPNGGVAREALYSEQFTSLLNVELKTPPAYVVGSGRTGRSLAVLHSAHRSLAELLKMGITLLEDIEPSELSGGVKREGVWGIYLADTLDNGSGYARKYAAPEEFERLVGYVESVLFREYLVQDEHSVPCISSCHKCLRNYENRMVHSSLDWRLAVDLLHVYLGGHPDKIYMDEHWQSVFVRAYQLLQNLVRTEVVDIRTDQGMVFQFEMKRRRTGLLMRHPLLPPGLDERRALRETQSTLGLDRISSINPFFLLRDPVGELTRASESMLS